ncbi:MAG TPA: signal recognition particle receptor subunit alpha, partial [Acidobacteriota bacterium]|nr:signal recognition particle receptor subunit alpha [Acidobacteriota bacterium]
DGLLDELEETLLGADLGPELAAELRGRIAVEMRGRTIEGPDEVLALLRRELLALLPPAPPAPNPAPPRVTLVVGVNGSGKTTT